MRCQHLVTKSWRISDQGKKLRTIEPPFNTISHLHHYPVQILHNYLMKEGSEELAVGNIRVYANVRWLSGPKRTSAAAVKLGWIMGVGLREVFSHLPRTGLATGGSPFHSHMIKYLLRYLPLYSVGIMSMRECGPDRRESKVYPLEIGES